MLLWDTLTQRAPACGLHVAVMKDQHGQMAGLLIAAEESIAAWAGSTANISTVFSWDIDKSSYTSRYVP